MFKSNRQIVHEELLADINAAMADSDRLLKSLADEGGAQAAQVRAKVEQNLQLAKARLAEFERSVARKTAATVQRTDAYAHAHPWQLLGAAAGIGLLLGYLLRQR